MCCYVKGIVFPETLAIDCMYLSLCIITHPSKYQLHYMLCNYLIKFVTVTVAKRFHTCIYLSSPQQYTVLGEYKAVCEISQMISCCVTILQKLIHRKAEIFKAIKFIAFGNFTGWSSFLLSQFNIFSFKISMLT